jgi:hypothetical protein
MDTVATSQGREEEVKGVPAKGESCEDVYFPKGCRRQSADPRLQGEYLPDSPREICSPHIREI